jgi:hypothetical protein
MSLGSLQRPLFLKRNGMGSHICSNPISFRQKLVSSGQTREQYEILL